MKHPKLRLRAAGITILLAFASAIGSVTPSASQAYHNIVNQRFRTIGDGPQSVIVVDVADPNDVAGVRRAVDAQVSAVSRARQQAMSRQINSMRQHGLLKKRQSLPLVDMVMLRQNGRLVTPPPPTRSVTRQAPASNTINFVLNTTGNYAFSTDPTHTDATGLNTAGLSSLVNTVLYPQLVSLLGPPFWKGTVTILNKDDNPTLNSGIIGVTVINNSGAITIDLPNFSTAQDEVLGLLQAMAQTFHGSTPLGYDAWETGMARAATVVAAQQLQFKFSQILPSGVLVDPAADFYFTPYYDVLNQPALGNSTFLPPTQSSQALAGLGGMIIPRLQTSSTAWLKCYIETLYNSSGNSFFLNFNNAYYDAVTADPTVAQDVTRLTPLAAQAIGKPNVEGQPFTQWFQQQYVFDTSVSPGNKVYAFVQPTEPDATHPEDGASVVLLYYQTTTSGDEVELSGTCYPVFYDYTFTNRLTLSGGDAPIPITGGEGTTAPYFTQIGSPAQMLLAMDFPVNGSYQRVYYPANVDTTTTSTPTPNDFFGVVVGSSTQNQTTGKLTASFSAGNGTPVSTTVTQGAFGAVGGASIPNNFTQTTLTYQPVDANGNNLGSPITYVRNVFQRIDNSANGGLYNVSSLFVLTAPSPVVTLPPHIFLGGPAEAYLVSLPIQPLTPDLAAVFQTTPTQTLIAEWQQSLATSASDSNDHYMRYPNLPAYQPGYGLWTGFPGALNGSGGSGGIPITGVPTDNQTAISVSLQYGWNLIGNPYNTAINLTNDGTTGSGGIQFQYLGGDSDDYPTSLSNGWITAGVWGWDFNSTSPTFQSYLDITNLPATTTSPTFQANLLETWNGYWILVNVPEGLTLTYYNPNPNTRSAAVAKARSVHSRGTSKAAVKSVHGGWQLPITVTDPQGLASQVRLGQSPQGSDQYLPALDAANPPGFVASRAPYIRFPHPDWNILRGVSGGDFLSDIRRTGSETTWNVAVDIPKTSQSYTLSWGGQAKLPRGLSLTLTDLSTNTRTLMNVASSYSFTPSQGETTSRFQITAAPNGLTFIGVTNLMVVPAPTFGGRSVPSATISYQLNGVAESSISIRSVSGRTVRHLAQSRAATAGVNQMVWDMKDDRGRALPSGVYTIEVQALSSDGRQTRATVPYVAIR